ncbi:NUDIX domain-containing protein [Bacillus sp. CGMCC 1.16541]|uniref:NUDIX domain-containing protein n=1 Tax=Bacillus sp. CGMCC 1.16541 TaxID=2185143 RepID=UPI000D73F7EF|nr:NUDIX domain-containing protein [Bacillus sp. CGMCC 1.16541]
MRIRNSAKALIVEDERVLLVKYEDEEGEYYALPGGGQGYQESIIAALQRECIEEIGVEVMVGPLAFVREYIGKNHEFFDNDHHIHQVEFIYHCTLKDKTSFIENGALPDPGQLAVEWISVHELLEKRMYPSVLKQLILSYQFGEHVPTYIGDTN